MHYSLYQLTWLFILYSLIGWVIGTSSAALRKRKFIDVGALFGPYCPSYGLGGVCFAVFLSELKDQLFFLFLGGVILTFFLSVMTGLILEKIFHRKWWDYSDKRMQFGGYVRLISVLAWGASALVCILFLNPLFTELIALIPELAGIIILFVICLTILIDLIGTISAITVVRSRIKRIILIDDVSESLQKAADAMGEGLTGWVLKHLEKAYSGLDRRELVKVRREEKLHQDAEAGKPEIFARGCGFYKLACLFFSRLSSGRYNRNYFLLYYNGRTDEPKQCCIRPVQYCLGHGLCPADSHSISVP